MSEISVSDVLPELEAIKAQYDHIASKPKHTNRGDFCREWEMLRKAMDTMREAISHLPPGMAHWICEDFDFDAEYPCPLDQIQDGLVRLSSLGMEFSFPRQTRSPESYARNVFILRVKKLYEEKTGLRATIRVKHDTSKLYGPFPEFLEASARKVGLPIDGLVRQAKRLRKTNQSRTKLEADL